jgi:DNA-binding MarR family transcriptional regulator
MKTEKLTDQELLAWRGFRRMAEVISSRIASELQKATGISGQDFAILALLKATCHGELRQRDIQQFLGWDKSRLSHQLSRMETRAVVTRENRSGQGVMVCITEEGIRQITEAEPLHAAAVRQYFLKFLTTEDTAVLTDIAGKLRKGNEPDATYEDFQ